MLPPALRPACRVARDAELFTAEELLERGTHGIYQIRISYETYESMLLPSVSEGDGDDEGDGAAAGGRPGPSAASPAAGATASVDAGGGVVSAGGREEPGRGLGPMLTVVTHPHDSVFDVKQMLEESHAGDWGMAGRQRNRDGSLRGWELVQEDGALEGGGTGSVVLSYHMFLMDYEIEHGDVLHAVVRRE